MVRWECARDRLHVRDTNLATALITRGKHGVTSAPYVEKMWLHRRPTLPGLLNVVDVRASVPQISWKRLLKEHEKVIK